MRYVLSLILLALLMAACSKRQMTPVREAPPDGFYYDIAWVNPEVVISDTVFTLMRAERVDSFLVEVGSAPVDRIPSVAFEIFDPGCNVVVNLLDSDQRVVRPLLVQNLPTGCYRLTLNVSQAEFYGVEIPPGTNYLRVDFCDQRRTASFYGN